jgi:hypothetical protein
MGILGREWYAADQQQSSVMVRVVSRYALLQAGAAPVCIHAQIFLILALQ